MKKYVIDEKTWIALSNFLTSRPFAEVYQLIGALAKAEVVESPEQLPPSDNASNPS